MATVFPTLTNTGPFVSLQEIERFEREHGIYLPEPYKTFLREFNGGQPDRDRFFIPNFSSGPEGVVQAFYGIRHQIEGCSLGWAVNVIKPSIPEPLLPIATDGGGDQICIGWYGDQIGKVFFWYFHDMPHDPDWADVYLLAEDFDQFFRGLYSSCSEDELERMLRLNDTQTLKHLLDAGYDMRSRNKYGRTLIEEAACFNRPEIIEILFNRGAELQNALRCASENLEFSPEHQASVALLKRLSTLRMDPQS